jgi:sugar lactone lactonase YvrE
MIRFNVIRRFPFPLRRLAGRVLLALLVFLVLGPALALYGQSTVFMGALPMIDISSWPNAPRGIARDAQGNLWVSSASNGVIEIQATNGGFPNAPYPTNVQVAAGNFNAPAGLAFDSAGDLWVADVLNNAIKEIVAVSGVIPASPTVNTVVTGLNIPWGLAFDSAGDLWFSDSDNNAIKEIVAVSGSIPSSPTVRTVSSQFSSPEGVWVDAKGNVFVSDAGNNVIKELPGVAPPAAATPPGSPTVSTIATGFSNPDGIAVDASGDVWVADDNNLVYKEIVAVSGSIPSNPVILSFPTDTIDNPAPPPSAVTIDANGNIFLASEASGGGAAIIDELTLTGNFYQVQVGYGSSGSSTNNAAYMNLLFGFLASTTGVQPVVSTQGLSGLDFSDAGSGKFGTCTTNGASYAYSAGDTCTVYVKFAPKAVGTRLGAAELTSESGILSTGYFMGTGAGPLAVFTPSAIPSLGGGWAAPMGVAVDAAGNVYVGDTDNNAVKEMPAACASSSCVTTLGGGFNEPVGVVVDAAGNVYVGDAGSGLVKEMPAGCASSSCVTTRGGAFSFLSWIAVDIPGNVYVGDYHFNAVYEMPVGCASTNCAKVLGGGFNTPEGIAVDVAGNVYVADTNNKAVKEMPPGCASSSCVTALGGGFKVPMDVAVDGTGNVYVVDDWGGGTAYEMPAGCASSSCVMTLGGGFNQPMGGGVDGAGNVYVVDWGNDAVKEITRATPPSLTFATTAVGSTSSDSPQNVTVANIGNAALNLDTGTNPLYPTDFPENTSASQLCAGGATLTPGESCDVSINFTPTTSGPLSEKVRILDNNQYQLFETWVTQYIPVSGTATSSIPAPTINWTPTTPITYGTALGSGDFAATAIYNSTDISADGTFAYYVGSVGGTTATAGTILPVGNNQLCVQWTPSSSYASQYSSASTCVTIVVNAASTTISWTPASPIIYPATLGSGQFDAAAMFGSANVSSDGTFTYYVGSVGGTVATTSTVLSVGSDQLCVQWTPSSSYTADYNSSSGCATITVNAPTSISWTPASPITYGTALRSGQFNASASSGTTNIGADGTFIYYVTAVGGTVATTSTVLPGGSDTLCVQWTPSSSYTSQYSSASLCVPITVNTASTSISWSPSSTNIIASTGPTSGQLDAAALAGSTNVSANGALTYYLSVVGGTQISVGSTLALGPATICVQWAPSSSYTADYNSSSACQSFTVINTQPTTTTLASNINPVFLSNSVTFTATVTPSSGAIVPTGTVTFYDGSTAIGTGTLSASGSGASAVASLTTTSLAAGSHVITAVYSGDTNSQGSTTTITLVEVVEDFSVTANSPSSSTVEPGTSATYSITVSPLSPATTFPSAITVSAAGLPTGATARFSPATIAAGAGSTQVTLTVTTPITMLSRNLPPRSPAEGARWPLAAVALLLLPLAGKFRRAGRRLSRRLALLLVGAAALTAVAALNGCGGTPSGYFGQAPATSSITVTGTSGSLNHSASVSLTVE